MPAVGSAFIKLNPRVAHDTNPVMFVLEVVTVTDVTVLFLSAISLPMRRTYWLFEFTDHSSGCGSRYLFANFAEAVAEGRGKAQAERRCVRQRTETQAKLLIGRG